MYFDTTWIQEFVSNPLASFFRWWNAQLGGLFAAFLVLFPPFMIFLRTRSVTLTAVVLVLLAGVGSAFLPGYTVGLLMTALIGALGGLLYKLVK